MPIFNQRIFLGPRRIDVNRSRVCGRDLFLLAFSMFLCSVIWTAYAQTPGASPNAAKSGGPRLAEASNTFAATCAGCHGLDGRGAERGPNIASRQEVLRRSDAELLGILQKGIPAAGMPGFAALGKPKLEALVSYLRTLQGKGAAMPVIGNPKQGEILFFGTARCSECHMANGRGGFIGTDLSAYAMDSSPDSIRLAIVKPDLESKHGRAQIEVTLQDGRMLEGIVRNEDNFTLQLQTLNGTFHFLQRSELLSLKPLARPLMPDDYGQTLSAPEIDDLVGYLMSVARSAPEQAPKRKAFDDD